MTHFWLRSEDRGDEYRTPITPGGARKLLNSGIKVTVEESSKRIFPTDEYSAIGCEIASKGSWKRSPSHAIVLGLKELDNENALSHRHIMFAHVFKGQKDSTKTLACFKNGGGILYDLEYLTDTKGKRVAAFGRYAGFAGAAVGLKIWLTQNRIGLNRDFQFPSVADRNEILTILEKGLSNLTLKNAHKPRVIIIGAHGRVGNGAKELCSSLAIETTYWDLKETAGGGPFLEILDYDVFVNCVLATPSSKPLIDESSVKLPRKLKVISDVSCDPGSPYNTIPLYDQPNSFSSPFHTIMAGGKPLYVTAIDNLPAMLPRESSLDFENQILDYFVDFEDDKKGVWARAEKIFNDKIRRI